MPPPSLHWLPADPGWREQFEAWRASPDATWETAVHLAKFRLDFIQTRMLDHAVQQRFGPHGPAELSVKTVRLAVLGSSTLAHLHAGIRVAAMRRGLWITTYESAFGQYWQELLDCRSDLHAFRPTAVLFCFDAHHVAQGASARLSQTAAESVLNEQRQRIQRCWQMARQHFSCHIVQQTVLPILPALLGGNEHRLRGSACDLVHRVNGDMRTWADAHGVDLVALDEHAAMDGWIGWHDPALWCRSKQEISPAAVPVYGELVTRVLAAQQGLSFKCLVLDLDDTLWGGAVADCGTEGLVLGQGSALGEGFVSLQKYAKELGNRGAILAVCSKNSEAAALAPFDRHPEMVLHRDDIACFVANWDDKATNLRRIARQLNIGLDSLVFLDDNPAERDLVRRELPQVAVPELPDDPALVPYCLAAAGYFEALAVTPEDLERTQQYQGNVLRHQQLSSSTDLDGFLLSLQMRLLWQRFDLTGLPRIVQLINKTNQFNLTTKRYNANEVQDVMSDAQAIGLQLRLVDRFGDNGIIAVVIGRMRGEELVIDTWLMSCRVLGRQIEHATLGLIAGIARSMGAVRLVGHYVETAKNHMVKDHYVRLGFKALSDAASVQASALELDGFVAPKTFVQIEEVDNAPRT
jgi:FkbH-like protein